MASAPGAMEIVSLWRPIYYGMYPQNPISLKEPSKHSGATGNNNIFGALMLVTLVSMVMVTTWALVISLIWAMVRKFHRSKPPGRQTVRIGDWCTVH